MLREGADAFRDFARIIVRAELAGVAPAKMLGRGAATPAMQLATLIAGLQAKRRRRTKAALDPKLVSAYVNAALFAFATMAPWLMTSVGLRPKDYEKRKYEIVDITLAPIELLSARIRPATPAAPPPCARRSSGSAQARGGGRS